MLLHVPPKTHFDNLHCEGVEARVLALVGQQRRQAETTRQSGVPQLGDKEVKPPLLPFVGQHREEVEMLPHPPLEMSLHRH